ncbi:amino acid transporter, putative [Bodo saltans]|uniref:Amino acid transporter, putative n=1 Tax=Bodo saltans TaxID=75058 RepID=A0A0S4JBX6_BODSA|nr:amino acid transporter, putative [Bodo saltans]|eukprot:CUG89020.1 amino acid transporter, putative [Bodo saltans]
MIMMMSVATNAVEGCKQHHHLKHHDDDGLCCDDHASPSSGSPQHMMTTGVSSENTTTAVTPVGSDDGMLVEMDVSHHSTRNSKGIEGCNVSSTCKSSHGASSSSSSSSSWMPSATTIAIMANIAASTARIGSFAMPYTAYRCGVAYFMIGMLLTVGLMSYSQYIICHVIEVTGLHSYEMITRRAFGDSHLAELLVEAMLIADCFGGTIATIVVIGDGVSSILRGTALVSSDSVATTTFVVQLAAFLVVMVPLSLPRTTSALKYASAFGVSAIAIVMAYATGRGILAADISNLAPVETSSFMSFSIGTSLLFFGFNNQFNTIEFYSEMKVEERTPRRFTKILLATMAFMGVVYIVMGLSELMEFGAAVTGNVLNSYDGGAPIAAIMIIAVLLKVTLSYPLLLFPTREALLHLIGVHDVKTSPKPTYYGATILIASLSFVVGVVLPNIVTLFGLIGSLCVGTFAFILPSLFFWKFSILHRLSGNKSTSSSNDLSTSNDSFVVPDWVHVAANVVNFIVGCFIVIAGTASAFLEL